MSNFLKTPNLKSQNDCTIKNSVVFFMVCLEKLFNTKLLDFFTKLVYYIFK